MFVFTRRCGLRCQNERDGPAFISRFDVSVVVQFHPRFKFSFLLFLDMVKYDNEFERERKFKPRIKLNHNISNIVVKNKKKVSKMLKEFRCEFITRR